MNKVALIALRKAQGAFLITHLHEFEVLDTLPMWFTRLFHVLLRCADHRTGEGSVTYAGLIAMLTPIQPAKGGARHPIPDRQALKRALRELEGRRILARDKRSSQAGDSLFFAVAPRYVQVRPKPSCDPGLGPPPKSPQAPIHAASETVPGELCPPVVTPSSIMNSLHRKRELSTDEGMRKPTLIEREMLARMKSKRALK